MKGPIECQQSPTREQKSSTSGKSDDVDFSEYMWMAEELEEFDRKVSIHGIYVVVCHLNS